MIRLWFKAKTYGYGWTPATWEGFLVVLLYVLLNTGGAILMGTVLPTWSPLIVIAGFGLFFVFNTIFLITICIKKGEPLRWHWGEGATKKTNE